MKTLALRERDLAALRATFRRFPWVREVRVFGSRATGHARRASDLDLAISAPDATATEWSELAEALERAPLIYELDLVRPEQTTNARLAEKIAREGVTIYPEPPPVHPGPPAGSRRL
jgi:predicted nucleotidyltransferase